MRTHRALNDLERRAMEALRALLAEVSAVKLKEIRREAPGSGSGTNLVALIDVLGHSYTVTCEVRASAQPERLRAALNNAGHGEHETRVIFAPVLSPEAQTLCKASHAGFLDLEGNARIALGEIFICRRCSVPRTQPQSAASPTSVTSLMKQLPPGAMAIATRPDSAAFHI